MFVPKWLEQILDLDWSQSISLILVLGVDGSDFLIRLDFLVPKGDDVHNGPGSGIEVESEDVLLAWKGCFFHLFRKLHRIVSITLHKFIDQS